MDPKTREIYTPNTGRLEKMNAEHLTDEQIRAILEERYNPYHDPTNGMFTSGNEAGWNSGAALYVDKGEKGNGSYILKSSSAHEDYVKHYEQIKSTLHDVESDRRSLDYEVGTIVDRTGKVVNVTIGEAHSVNPPHEKLKDCIFTHNHPSGHCFSPDDVENAIKDDVLELRASTPQGTYYSLFQTENASGSMALAYEYSKAVGVRRTLAAVDKDLRAGIISKADINEALYLKYSSIAGDEFLINNAEKYGYIYTKGAI